jgi:lysosomal alpha-mannosidase
LYRDPQPVAYPLRTISIKRGKVNEITQRVSPFATQTLRLYSSNQTSPTSPANFLEIEYHIGVLDPDRELITRFSTNIKSNGKFNTDSNVLLSLERDRVEYPSKNEFPVQNNYYATQYSSFIRDDQVQLTILTNTTRGTSSLKDGEWEMMLHRRCSQDDKQGLAGYPLNDTTVVQVKLRITLDAVRNEKGPVRVKRAHELNFPLDLFFFENVPQGLDIKSYNYTTRLEPISKSLPTNVHLQTLQVQRNTKIDPSDDSPYIVRFVNTCEHDNTTVNLQDYFANFKIGKYVETTLTANQALHDQPKDLNIALGPQQIRTFLLHLKKN